MPEAEPELTKPPEAVRQHILQHYEDHRQTYAKVWDRLDQTRALWFRSLYEGRIALLKASYVWSVISVQTPVEIHEETFERVMDGQTLDQAWRAGAGFPVKIDFIREQLMDQESFDELLRLLENGKIDAAHDHLLDFGYLGTAKAPFAIANLGFTRKMCLDANVLRLLRADRSNTTSVDTYERLCGRVQDMFPELAEILAPYELQWLLFDYQRYYRSGQEGTGGPAPEESPVAYHDAWFRHVLGDIDYLIAQMDRITAEAHALGADNYEQGSKKSDLLDTDPQTVV